MKKLVKVIICLLPIMFGDILWAGPPAFMQEKARLDLAAQARGATVEGIVLSRLKKDPQKDIRVYLLVDDETGRYWPSSFYVMTDESGRFRFIEVLPGTYSIGYKKRTDQINCDQLERADGSWPKIVVSKGRGSYSFGHVFLMTTAELASVASLLDASSTDSWDYPWGEKLIVLFKIGKENPWEHRPDILCELLKDCVPESETMVCISEERELMGFYRPSEFPAYKNIWNVKVVRLYDGTSWSIEFDIDPPRIAGTGINPWTGLLGELKNWLKSWIRGAAKPPGSASGRIAWVRRATDQGVLAKIAKTASDPFVREIAEKKLLDTNRAAILSWIDIEATKKLEDQRLLAEIATTAGDWKVRATAVDRLADQAVLAKIAMTDEYLYIRLEAVKRLTDQAVLAEIAKMDRESDLRAAAAARNRLEEIKRGSQNKGLELPSHWSTRDTEASVAHTATPAGIVLEYKMPVGRILSYKDNTDSLEITEAMGQSMEAHSTIMNAYSFKGKGLKEQNLLLGVTIDEMAMTVTGVQGDLLPNMKDLKGKTFDMALSPLGTEVDVSGAEAITYKFATVARDVASNFKLFFPDLPGIPLKIGDSWPSSGVTDVKVGTLTMRLDIQNVNTFEGIESVDGMECARISSRVTGSISGSGSPMGKDMTFSGTHKGTDLWFFAIKEGIYVQSTSELTTEIFINVGSEGMTIPSTQMRKSEIKLVGKS